MHGTHVQPYSLLAFLYAGCIVGMLTGALGAFRLLCRRRLALALADALCAALCCAVTACAFYVAEKGALRLYGFLSIVLGALIFRIVAGEPLTALARKAAERRREREREAARSM